MTKSPEFLNPLLGIQILKHVEAAESKEHDSKWYHVPLRTQLRAKHHILLDDNDSPQASKHLPTRQRASSKIEPRFISQAIYQHPSSSSPIHSNQRGLLFYPLHSPRKLSLLSTDCGIHSFISFFLPLSSRSLARSHERFPKHTVLSQAYSFKIQDCMKMFAAMGYNSGRGVYIQERIVWASGMKWGFEIYICV